jgi:crotonobetainyl-CoA:carnitine CoA-transferase CaiB-like acyl-CoA transferase
VWVSVRGAGGDGPDGAKPGYDVMAQARSGLMSVTGTSEPTKVGVAVADVVTGLYAAVGALAGLVAAPRRREAGTGPLQVEVGLLEAAVAMLVNQAANALVGGVVPTYAGNDHPNIAPYGPRAVRGAGRLVVGAGNERSSPSCAGRSTWCPSRRGRPTPVASPTALRLGAALADVFPPAHRAGVGPTRSGAVGVPCAPVQDLGSLPDDPQVQATGQLQRVAHPAGDVRVVGSPYRLDGERPRVRRAHPAARPAHRGSPCCTGTLARTHRGGHRCRPG